MLSAPRIDPAAVVLEAGNPAGFIRQAFEGGDLGPAIEARKAAILSPEPAPGALLDLSILYQLVGRAEEAMACQAAALQFQRLFRHPAPAGTAAPLRLLAIMTTGDLMANTPLELMLEGRAVEIVKLFVRPGDSALPPVPDHDVAILAIGESDESAPLLGRLEGLERSWPRPLINSAAAIGELARDRLHLRLVGAAGVQIPPTVRTDRGRLAARTDFPLIVRPVGSHAGKGLEKLDRRADLAAYLEASPAALFYVSPFVDYASADGRFRKYRIILFDGRPFLAHMAIGDHWMVHYLNAGMAEDAAKRAEEGRVMGAFDQDFAVRHAAGLASLAERIGLGLFAVDCAEAPDGSLLIFEADVAMIVHDLDPPDLYPYKKRQMPKVFDAFEAFLRRHAVWRP